MRVVPERSPWLQLVAVFGGFFIGPYCALRASSVLSPGAEIVQTIAVFAFAFVFVAGMLLWMGLGVAKVVFRALGHLLPGRLPTPVREGPGERMVPPGYRVFLVLGMAAGAGIGVLTGVFTELAVSSAIALWTLLGTLYGGVLWFGAHHGHLPFPEPA